MIVAPPVGARTAAVRAGVLVGGRSRRMGRPKWALRIDGERLLDRVVAVLAPVAPVTLLGELAGEPVRRVGADGLSGASGGEPGRSASPPPPLHRLADAPGVAGPLAGLLAALRWAPVPWLVAACDLPRLTPEAVAWLLAQRAPGTCAVLPRVGGRVQPLLAVYEPAALPMLERLMADGSPAPHRLAGLPAVATPEPPPALAAAWRGVNTPEELAALSRP